MQKGLQSLLNTCPVCKTEYADGASMVGCDVCGYWYHFACVGLRRAPARKRDWFFLRACVTINLQVHKPYGLC